MRESNVYILDFVDGRVESWELTNVDRAASANDVLTDVLGVPAPIPIWVEHVISEIVQDFQSDPLTEQTVEQIRVRLAQAGIGHLFPETVGEVVKNSESS
jgi:hypothetical protein